MKKRAVCIILGVLLTGAMFTGCGKNKATEAASESAQTEKEGVGEDVEKDSETDKKLLVKISICNDKMEVIEEQECEMIIESKGTFEVE